MTTPGRNVEVKARLRDPAATQRLVQWLCGPPQTQLLQTDTYFGCAHGRLKLRETPQGAQLIWYLRPDAAAPQTSCYRLVPVADASGLRAALAEACGIRCVVAKRRQLYWYRNVRVHLDEVAGLGHFLELEAVLAGDSPPGHEVLPDVTDLAAVRCRAAPARGDAARAESSAHETPLPSAPAAARWAADELAATQLVAWLCAQLEIAPSDLLDRSYGELMAEAYPTACASQRPQPQA
jgi:adenylate cyclase class IV